MSVDRIVSSLGVQSRVPAHALILLLICQTVGCQSAGQAVRPTAQVDTDPQPFRKQRSNETQLTGFDDESDNVDGQSPSSLDDDGTVVEAASLAETSVDFESKADITDLSFLVSLAQSQNPKLIRLNQEAAAAWAKTRYVDKLPDPTVGVNVFGHPIETASGSQRANLTLMQMIPWLDRLDAQQQQACFEAIAIQQMYNAERLRVIGDIRANYYRLYILTRQIETIEANQELLVALVEIVNARVATGKATQGMFCSARWS